MKSMAKNPQDLTILVTGGAGFIGSHTVVELLAKGYSVVIVDDLSNSDRKVIDRIRAISGVSNWDPRLKFYEASLLDQEAMGKIFAAINCDAIIHFAGFKAVGESSKLPLKYYMNNVGGTLQLLELARLFDVKNIVFSSSATVYGEPEFVPITESCPKHEPTNPYGRTKSMLEQILTDVYVGDNEWNIVLLRYFNPIGAHPSGLIGEDPKDIPNNLVPYIARVAVGKLERLGVFGNDYPTPDGTGIRDYIHVVDLARGHVAALDWMGGKIGTGKASDAGSIEGPADEDGSRHGVGVFNLGTGTGSSVMEVLAAYEKACGRKIPYEVLPRREGDIAENFAACDKAREELGWEAAYDLERMCQDSWRWQSHNPNGYR